MADNQTGSGYDGDSLVLNVNTHRVIANTTHFAAGTWNNLELCIRQSSAGAGGTVLSNFHFCEQSAGGNCTAGTLQVDTGGTMALADADTVQCRTFSNTSAEIDSSKNYLVGYYAPTGGITGAVKYWSVAAGVAMYTLAGNYSYTESVTGWVGQGYELGMIWINGTASGSSFATVTFSSPSTGITANNLTAGYTPKWYGDAYANCSLWANSTNSGFNATSLTNASVNYITNNTLMGSGSYTVFVGCQYSNSTWVNSSTISFTLVAPSVNLTAPLTNTYDDNLTVEYNPKWYPVTSTFDNCSLWANSTNSGFNATSLTNASTNYITNNTLLGDGQYSLYMGCQNATSWYNSSAVTFYLDTTNPSVNPINSPVNTTTYFVGSAITLNATFNDNLGLYNCTVNVYYPANNSTAVRTNTTLCSGTSLTWANETFTTSQLGEHRFEYVVYDNVGNYATNHTNITLTGMSIDVFDEKSFGAVACWSVTMTNSTGTTYTATCQNNTFTWSNYSSVPTGSVTLAFSATGYVGRTYYRTYSDTVPLELDVYLLNTSDGVYSYFLVQSSVGTALYGASLVFTFQNGSDWLTAGEVLTDSTGSATMWLDWTKSYIVTASLTGYDTVTKTFTPQPTTYLIIMGSSSVFNYSHLNDTLWTFFDPTDPEVNITSDSITAGLLDPDSTISICGLNLTYYNGTVFNSTNTTTEQSYCLNTISLLGSGALAGQKFWAVLWYTVNGTDGNVTKIYNPLNTDYSLNDAQSGLYSYLGGPDARLLLAVFITLFSGAAAAMYLGIGAVVVMMGVSGALFYWGWFAGYELLYIVVFVVGAALLYLESRT